MINRLTTRCNKISTEKGFWDASDNIPEKLALIHSEVSEALEEYRKPKLSSWDFGTELADICIRVFDLAGHLNLNLEDMILAKIEKNENREYLHGKKF